MTWKPNPGGTLPPVGSYVRMVTLRHRHRAGLVAGHVWIEAGGLSPRPGIIVALEPTRRAVERVLSPCYPSSVEVWEGSR